MSLSPFVFEATAQDFEPLAAGNSRQGPVLVYFWAPGAGPCVALTPRLVRLATEYAGRFLLVMVNTDDLGRIARDYGVTSRPTLKLFVGGRVIETLQSVPTDEELRALIDAHLVRPSDHQHAQAVAAFEAGDPERGFALLTRAGFDDPANLRIPVDHAKLLIRAGRVEEAEALLGELPDDIQERSEIVQLRAHAGFLQAAVDAPDDSVLQAAIGQDADDLESRYRLAARRVVAGDVEGALDQLVEIVARDTDYRADAARRGIGAVFAMLGDEGPVVDRYRAKLRTAMRSHQRER